MLHACAARFDVTGNVENFWELNKALIGDTKFLGVISDVSKECWDSSGNCKINLLSIINLLLAHIGYCST